MIKETDQVKVMIIEKNALHASAPLPQWKLVFHLDISYLFSDSQNVNIHSFLDLARLLFYWIIISNNVHCERFHNISNKQLKILTKFILHLLLKLLHIKLININLTFNLICRKKYLIFLLTKVFVNLINLDIIINSCN